MIRKTSKYLKKITVPAAVIISSASLLSRLLGVVRDHLLTGSFGATREIAGQISELDAYYAAFKIPDFLYQLLILGTISAIFIPLFTAELDKNKKKAWKSAANILNVMIIVMTALSIFAFVFAPYIVKVFAFGFNEQTMDLTINLTRIMILSPIIFGMSAVMGSILNTHKRFLAYSMAPIVYNLGIIAGIIFLVPHFSIYGVAWGIVIGAILHFTIQGIAAVRIGFRPRAILDFKDTMLISMSKLAVPRIAALGANQINLLIDTAIASSLIAGSITILNLSQNLQFLPVGLIGISIAISSFPLLSGLAQKKETEKFERMMSENIRKILFLIIPATAAILLLRTEIVRLLFGSGEFNWTDTRLTANTFGIFSLSLFAQCLEPLFTRAFYAHKNTKTPLVITLIVVTVHIILSLLFSKFFGLGVLGLALSFSITSVLGLTLLVFGSKKKLKLKFNSQEIIISLIKIIIATLIMAVAIQLAKNLFGTPFGELDRYFKVIYKFAFSSVVGLVAYIGMTHLLQSKEWKDIKNEWLKK